jgi:8-oxo-dGTP pyrophosphatase MutT (NUDIX family)
LRNPPREVKLPYVLSVRRTAYRFAYHLLVLAALIRPRRGQGAKAALVHGGELLLVRHTYGPDRWELPGSGVRHGEEPLAALRRELAEELGLAVRSADALAVVHGCGRQRRHRTHLYRVDLDSPLVRADPVEIAEARWFDPAAPPARLGSMVAETLRLTGLNGPRAR